MKQQTSYRGKTDLTAQNHRETRRRPARLTQRDKYNGSGCLDMTAYLAMRNIECRGG